MAEVVLKHIEKAYTETVKAVKDLSVTIRDKEFTVLVGPSGCGKSTTLRMIAGLEDPTDGEILIDGVVVNDVSAKERDIAMVFQNYALYPHMTVYDNLAFALKMKKFERAEIDRRVREAAEILGLDTYLQRRPGELSGGQKQRVAVGRAIVRKPKVFLFDEPLSNLDAKLRMQMRAELSRLHQRLQATMIYVTHDQVEAMTLANNIIIMKDGVMQQQASPMTIYAKPANRFVAEFIGSPPMNFLDCAVETKGEDVCLDAGVSRLTLPRAQGQVFKAHGAAGGRVTLGVRPEDLHDRMFVKGSSSENCLRARVDVLEPLGSELQCILKAGPHELIAKFKPDSQIGVGDEIEMVVDMEKVHLFDAKTERRIE